MRSLIFIFALISSEAHASGLKIEIAGEGANGSITIDLLEETAPLHAERITALAREGAYDGVIFHRVIKGFMAQTGDIEFGKIGGDTSRAGQGGSSLPDLPQEFSKTLKFEKGVVGMARTSDPNSANSQFFIMLEEGYHLNGQYTVVGKVTSGMNVVSSIKLGNQQTGAVLGTPDMMKKVSIAP